MSIVKYNSNFPAKTFGHFFDDFFNRSLTDTLGSDVAFNRPSVNIIEHSEGYTIELAAPGLDKADFEVKAEKDLLKITAKKENKEEVKDGKYYRREFNYSSFHRNFQIPESVNSAGISANYNNGVLTVTLPKKEEVIQEETTKVIDIK